MATLPIFSVEVAHDSAIWTKHRKSQNKENRRERRRRGKKGKKSKMGENKIKLKLLIYFHYTKVNGQHWDICTIFALAFTSIHKFKQTQYINKYLPAHYDEYNSQEPQYEFSTLDINETTLQMIPGQ